MMEDYKFTLEEYKNISNYLLLELGYAGVLSESQIKTIHAHTRILNEQVEVEDEILAILDENEIIMESGVRIEYDGNNISVDYGDHTLQIPPENFIRVWHDPKYMKVDQVLLALGIPNDTLADWEANRGNSYMNTQINSLIREYNKYKQGNPAAPHIGSWSDRKRDIQARIQRQAGPDEGEPSAQPDMSQVAGGRRGRKDPAVDRINNAEIVPGEFYRDLTRITTGGRRRWLRFWKKDLRKVSSDRRGLLGHLIGKAWKRTFLLGYQVNQTIFYEVWYNSIDSSFSVYDRNGIEVSANVPTLQEAIRLLVRTIAQEAPGDEDVFSRGSGGRALSNSIERALSSTLGRDKERLRNEEEATQAEIRREMAEKKSLDRDAAKDRAIKSSKTKTVRTPNSPRGATPKKAGGEEKGDSTDSQNSRIRNAISSGVSRAATSAKKSAQVALATAAIDSAPSPKAKLRAHQQYGKTASVKSMDQYQSDMDEMQMEQYRASLTNIMKRMWGEVENLKSIADDPYDLTLSVDPTLGQYLSDFEGDPIEKGKIAKQAEMSLRSHAQSIEKLLRSTDYADQLQQEIDKHGQQYLTSVRTHMELVSEKLFGPNRRRSSNVKPFLKEAFDTQGQRSAATYYDSLRDRQDAVKADDAPVDNETTASNQGDPFEWLQSREMDRRSQEIKQRTKASPYHKQLLIQDISDSIEVYDITKVRQSSMKNIFASWLGKLRRGRRAPIQNPMDGRGGFFSRLKQTFLDQEFRADFVVGYSLSGTINIEIWYITELDPGGSGRMISSFYVYDVTAQKIVRSHLPYIRNAIPVVAAKLGVTSGGL